MITNPRFITAALLVLMGACTSGTPLATGPAPVDSLDQAYALGMANAAMYSPRNVLPLKPALPDSAGNVRVVRLSSAPMTVGRDSLDWQKWVTVVPEVRDSCARWTEEGADVKMRLRQLLGLHPADSVAWFSEMTVPAAAMFRPTVDPAVTTRWPCANGLADASCGLVFPDSVGAAHRAWMANQMLSSWQVPNGYPASGQGQPGLGYPWTRLGYTYNWHPGSPRYGASEYLVRQGAWVNVTSVNSIAAYCAAS